MGPPMPAEVPLPTAAAPPAPVRPPAGASLEELLELSLQQPRKAAAVAARPAARPSPAAQRLVGELDMTPPPKLAPPPSEPAYALGGDLAEAAPIRAPALPDLPERELRDLALKRATENAPRSGLGDILGLGGALAGRGVAGATLRGAGALNRMRGPSGLDLAIKEGSMVPSRTASEAARTGVRGAYDLSGAEDFALGKMGRAREVTSGLLGSADSLLTSKAYAQDVDHVAYADAPTFNYAVSAVLHAGGTGLSQADEQSLTSAVVGGDDKQLAATSFRLRQKYPAYAQRVERELRGLNEEE
jgi:hypothetical protein